MQKQMLKKLLSVIIVLSSASNSLEGFSAPCDEVIEACDRVIEHQSNVIGFQGEQINALKKLNIESEKEVDRLRVKADRAIQPWVLFTLGVLAGGVAYSVLAPK